MKTLFRFPLLLMSIATLFLASCGEMKNEANGVDVVSDDDTYVAVGDFTSESPMLKEPLTGRTVAVDVNLDNHTADMTLYNFELNGAVMNILVKGLALSNPSETSCVISNGDAQIVPIVKMGDKDVLYNNCPLTYVNGTIDTKEKTMHIDFTIAYNNPLLKQNMDVSVAFNGKLVESSKINEVIPEEAKKTVDYEEEFAARGVLKVAGKVIPDNKVRVAIDKDDMKANLYLATLSLDNGNSFVTLQAQNLNVTETVKGYEFNAETAVPILEKGGQSIYYPYCEFRNVHGVIEGEAETGTMQITLVFVYVDPQTNKKDEYEASFIGSLVDPDEPDQVEQKLYNHDFLASGTFAVDVDNFSIDNRMVGVDINKTEITFYAFSYGDMVPELTILAEGINFQKTANGYSFTKDVVIPSVKTIGMNEKFNDARFTDMEGSIDTNNRNMDIRFTIVYTDPNTSEQSILHATYSGALTQY